MIVVCQQPNYFPWLGYLEQCARADIFIVLDSVQWIKQGWQHRARILTHPKAPQPYQWLTIPVISKGHRAKTLAEIEIAPDSNWTDDHWRIIQSTYGRRPFFRTQVEPHVRPWLESQSQTRLLNEALSSNLALCLKLLELKPRVVSSSTLPATGAKSERLVSLVRAVGGSTYYSGIASTRYIDHGAFRNADLRLLWQHWRHPEYGQGRERFQSHLSFVDALANVPLETLKAWLAKPVHAINPELDHA